MKSERLTVVIDISDKTYHIKFKLSLKWPFLAASEGTVISLQYEDFL